MTQNARVAGGADPGAHNASRAGDVRHAVVAAGTNILAMLAGLTEAAFHPVAAHVFGPAAYGLYRWGVSSIDPLLRLSPLGTDLALLRYVASHRVAGEADLVRRSVRTAVWITLSAGAALGASVFAFAGPLAHLQGRPEAAGTLRLLAPAIPCSALVVVLVYATMGARTTRYNLLVRGIAQPVLLLAVSVTLGVMWPTLAALCASHLAAAFFTALVAAWAAARVFAGIRPPVDRGPVLHLEMIRFSIPMGLAEFLNAVLQRADVILLAFYAGPETVGIYAGAEAVSRVVSNVRYAFDPVASPVLAEALRLGDPARLRHNLQLMTRWTVLLTVPLLFGMIAVRRELLGLFPAVFLAGTSSLVVLLAGHLVNGSLGLTGWVIVMSGRSMLALANNLVAAGANVVLCLALLPRYGMLGAAVSSTMAVTLLQLLQLAEAAWLHRVQPFSPGVAKALVAGVLSFVLVERAVPDFGAHVVWRAGARVGALVIAYGVLLALFGLAAEEREVLGRIVRRFKGRST